jgi:hypothetical protein
LNILVLLNFLNFWLFLIFNFHFEFSESIGLNWDNVFIAGGSVVASILSVPEDYGTSDKFLLFLNFLNFLNLLNFLIF